MHLIHDSVSALQHDLNSFSFFSTCLAIRSGDELSKIMAFFYYGAAKPPCLNGIRDGQEEIPSVPINAQP